MRMTVAEVRESNHVMERQLIMNRRQHNLLPQRFHQRPRHVRRSCTVLVVCGAVIAAMVMSSNAVAQQRLSQSEAAGIDGNSSSSQQSSATREQLARALETLRSAKAQPTVSEQSARPTELFLDLSIDRTAVASNAQSSQGMATSLDVSMTSSPTQVLMRAVAWIAIVLCICCLVILGARQWQRQRGLLPAITARAKVLATLSLGPSRTVSLIEMHGYRALVAADATGIRALVLAPSSFEDTIENEIVGNTED